MNEMSHERQDLNNRIKILNSTDQDFEYIFHVLVLGQLYNTSIISNMINKTHVPKAEKPCLNNFILWVAHSF